MATIVKQLGCSFWLHISAKLSPSILLRMKMVSLLFARLNVELGAIISARDWILTATKNLQELTNQNSMEQITDALCGVLRVAVAEVEAGEERRRIASLKPKPRYTGEVVIFPCDRNTWYLSGLTP